MGGQGSTESRDRFVESGEDMGFASGGGWIERFEDGEEPIGRDIVPDNEGSQSNQADTGIIFLLVQRADQRSPL